MLMSYPQHVCHLCVRNYWADHALLSIGSPSGKSSRFRSTFPKRSWHSLAVYAARMSFPQCHLEQFHGSVISPLWMWNAAMLRWTVSPFRKASFDSNSFTVYPTCILLISCARKPSRAPSKTLTIVPVRGFFSRMALLSRKSAWRLITSLSVWQGILWREVLWGYEGCEATRGLHYFGLQAIRHTRRPSTLPKTRSLNVGYLEQEFELFWPSFSREMLATMSLRSWTCPRCAYHLYGCEGADTVWTRWWRRSVCWGMEPEEKWQQRPGIPPYTGSREEAPSSGALKTKLPSALSSMAWKYSGTQAGVLERGNNCNIKTRCHRLTPGLSPEESLGSMSVAHGSPARKGEQRFPWERTCPKYAVGDKRVQGGCRKVRTGSTTSRAQSSASTSLMSKPRFQLSPKRASTKWTEASHRTGAGECRNDERIVQTNLFHGM